VKYYWCEQNAHSQNQFGQIIARIHKIRNYSEGLPEIKITKIFYKSGFFVKDLWKEGAETTIAESDLTDERGVIIFTFEGLEEIK
jgi:hypothetical protein